MRGGCAEGARRAARTSARRPQGRLVRGGCAEGARRVRGGCAEGARRSQALRRLRRPPEAPEAPDGQFGHELVNQARGGAREVRGGCAGGCAGRRGGREEERRRSARRDAWRDARRDQSCGGAVGGGKRRRISGALRRSAGSGAVRCAGEVKKKTRRRDRKRRDREMNKKYSNFAWTPNRGPLWKARAGNPGRETPPGGSHPRTLSWGWRNFREGPDGVNRHINTV